MFDYQYNKEQLLGELGIDEAEEGYQQHVLSRIERVLDERVLERVLAELTEEQMKEFNEADSKEAAQRLIRTFVPMFDEVCDEEFTDLIVNTKLTLGAL